MTYKKPADVTYTQMAIWIDGNIHEESYDEEKAFQYMYHLFYILAVKGKMFLTAADYDSYALYGATQLFLRYKKEQKPGSTLKPIKSCLNYIKKVLYPLKINYQKTNFSQVFPGELMSSANEAPGNQLRAIQREGLELMRVEYSYCLTQIATTIKMIVKESPYGNNAVVAHNLYLSCLLTILKSITMSNKNRARLRNKEARYLSTTDLIDRIYAEESKEGVVLYHLPKSLGNYVRTMVARCKKEITKDLRYIIGSYELPDSVMRDIMMQPLAEIRGDE